MNAYKILGWLAMLLTPTGAVIFFGWRVYTAVSAETSTDYLAIPAGIAAAVGLEMIGIFAGHMTMELWQRHDSRAWLAAIIMAIYVIIGVVELSGTIGQVMFLIAPLVYVLVGLRHSVDEQAREETAVSATRLDFQIEQARLDRQAERERQRQKQADETAVKLARIEAKKQKTAAIPQSVSQSSQTQPVANYECICGRVFPSSRSYNAHRRHCKIPANKPAKIYANGRGENDGE